MNSGTDGVTVIIPREWVCRVQSPIMTLIVVLSGVSITFVPLALFYLGQSHVSVLNPLVLLCFCISYFVPLFYMGLAGQVVRQLNRTSSESAASDEESSSGRDAELM